MGLLDELLGGLMQGGFGQAAGRPQPRPIEGGAGGGMSGALMALLPVVLSMLASRQGSAGAGASVGGLGGFGNAGGLGGLGALLEEFQRKGFGEHADSWVGAGQNIPI